MRTGPAVKESPDPADLSGLVNVATDGAGSPGSPTYGPYRAVKSQ